MAALQAVPNDHLVFEGPLQNRMVSSLLLQNTSANYLVYKIRTNAPKGNYLVEFFSVLSLRQLNKEDLCLKSDSY